jgi:hypothetical protein
MSMLPGGHPAGLVAAGIDLYEGNYAGAFLNGFPAIGGILRVGKLISAADAARAGEAASAAARAERAAALASNARRAVNLPAWRRLTIDWAHINPRHMPGGIYTEGRTVFEGMTQQQVERLLREQCDRLLAAVDGGDLVAGALEQRSHREANAGLVVHKQNARWLIHRSVPRQASAAHALKRAGVDLLRRIVRRGRVECS